jgi:hypothetical protein
MGKLFDAIREAVRQDRYLVSWHADERCEERGVTGWQVVAGMEAAELVRERPRSKPSPSIVVRQVLADGSEVEVIWSWLTATRWARLVTVYFRQYGSMNRERREKRKRWVQRGRYAVEVEVEVIYPADDPSEPCLEPATVRWLDEIARRAEQGDVAYLRTVGRLYVAVSP